MCSSRLLVCAVVGMFAACGEEIPPARYDLFTLELVELSEGARAYPGQALAYRVRYAGDLVRNLQFEATFTHEASGETASRRWSEQIQDTNRIDFRRNWTMQHEFLERTGRVRVQLRAFLTATRTGSEPWAAPSQSVYSELHPALDSLELSPASSEPLAYGTPITVRVTGRDLWRPVEVTVVGAETGAGLPDLVRQLSFDGSQTSIAETWTIRSPSLERIGTHRLRLVARYGELEVQSVPFAFMVTHTIDPVAILLRDPQGATRPPNEQYPRLGEVSGLVLRISGTQFAGHTFTVNGGPPIVAGSDAVEILAATPAFGDFAGGEGRRTYDFLVRSGGMERNAGITLQRWGIERCEWRSTSGQTLGEGQRVAAGSELTMHAELWGFPDTTTQWLFFRSPLAEFTVWESDPGGRPLPEEIDTLQNNDDEGESFEAEVRSNQASARWTAEFDDEPDPLDLHLNAAEYYFEVWVEDQVCSSSQLLVPASAR